MSLYQVSPVQWDKRQLSNIVLQDSRTVSHHFTFSHSIWKAPSLHYTAQRLTRYVSTVYSEVSWEVTPWDVTTPFSTFDNFSRTFDSFNLLVLPKLPGRVHRRSSSRYDARTPIWDIWIGWTDNLGDFSRYLSVFFWQWEQYKYFISRYISLTPDLWILSVYTKPVITGLSQHLLSLKWKLYRARQQWKVAQCTC